MQESSQREESGMAKVLVDDRLWTQIKPLLPPPKRRRRRYPGRKPLDNRQVLTGILFVLKTGIPWEYLPTELGCGSGMTCWRRLHTWQRAGVWRKLHRVLLAQLQAADQLDWSRAIVDSSSIRALRGGEKRGRIRRIDGSWGGSNTSLPHAAAPHPHQSRAKGLLPLRARRRTPHGSGLSIFRWVVERTIAWLHQFRRLRIRYERRGDIPEAFLPPGCAPLSFNFP